MPTLSINTGRVDWPKYAFFDVGDQPIDLENLQALGPELFRNSRVLLIRTGPHDWRRVLPGEELDVQAQYRTESVVDDARLAAASRVCLRCGVEQVDVSKLRYHAGSLSAHEWGHGITFRWEWTCCNLIVSNSAVASFDRSTGCNIGLCEACFDRDPYLRAVEQHEQEVAEAF